MNINFLNDKQNNSALLDIFIVKSLEIEILNNGTDTDSITDPWLLFFTFGKSEGNQRCSQKFERIVNIHWFYKIKR